MQVIKVGQGIHKDLVPPNVPDAQTLQNYLNKVFGLQTNTYFTVLPLDNKVVDYDISGAPNLALDASGAGLTPEQLVLDNQVRNPNAVINVYYVNTVNSRLNQNVWGLANISLAARNAYVGTSTQSLQTVMNTTAHEIGHCFGLLHSEQKYIYAGLNNLNLTTIPLNPGWIENSDPTIRLMYGNTLPGVTPPPMPELLVKPEWDIISKFTKK